MSISEVSNKRLLVKYVAPTKLDIAPVKTLWKVSSSKDTSEMYVQINEDIMNPKWERMGIFLEKALCEMLENKLFVDECYRLYIHHQNKPTDNISKMIKENRKP